MNASTGRASSGAGGQVRAWTSSEMRDWSVRMQWRTLSLDPGRADRAPRDEALGRRSLLQPTWYVGDRLLLDVAAPPERPAKGKAKKSGAKPPRTWFDDLDDEARRHDLRAFVEPENYEDLRLLDAVADELRLNDDTRAHLRRVFGTSLLLVPKNVGPQPDSWPLRTTLRQKGLYEDDESRRDERRIPVALDHVIVPAGGIGGGPASQPGVFSATQPFVRPMSMTAGHSVTGLSEYLVAGWGGRQPVAWIGAAPSRTAPRKSSRRPTVAILDTGVGSHPWFDGTGEHRGNVVVRDPRVFPKEERSVVGLQPAYELDFQDPEHGGVSIDPLTGPLDPVAGHGTFMAGLVHQMCPDATILAPRVYGGSGIVPERNLLRSLRRLLLLHLRGLAGLDSLTPVDVAVLSLGYYHETPTDTELDAPLLTVLRELEYWGVLVVCSTGNDGQVRETFPAAFAPRTVRTGATPRYADDVELDPERPPVIAVGAQNPDGTTALFSNDGDWVTCLRAGASLVSTAPVTIDGVVAPTRHMPELFARGARATIDPEGFQGGFAVWSGTSFSAPVLAGELAGYVADTLARDGAPDGSDAGTRLRAARSAQVARAWKALRKIVTLPPGKESAWRS